MKCALFHPLIFESRAQSATRQNAKAVVVIVNNSSNNNTQLPPATATATSAAAAAIITTITIRKIFGRRVAKIYMPHTHNGKYTVAKRRKRRKSQEHDTTGIWFAVQYAQPHASSSSSLLPTSVAVARTPCGILSTWMEKKTLCVSHKSIGAQNIHTLVNVYTIRIQYKSKIKLPSYKSAFVRQKQTVSGDPLDDENKKRQHNDEIVRSSVTRSPND